MIRKQNETPEICSQYVTDKFRGPNRNKTPIISPLNSNIMYSPRNKNAKIFPLYSVLNPDTSSDSASLKSNGARWVSPRVEINQNNERNSTKKLPCNDIFSIEILMKTIIINIIRVLKTASYEIACLTLRSPPNSAYFELDAQLLINKKKIIKVLNTRKNSRENLSLNCRPAVGVTTKTNILQNSLPRGA